MSPPFFSLIVPVYNVEKYIIRCLDSILNQTYTNFEVIIVDDETPDNSISIIEKKISDNRIRIISKKNGGLSDARNYGLEQALGEYIWFIDSDDYLYDLKALEKLHKKITEHKSEVEILVFNFKVMFDNSDRESYIVKNSSENTGIMSGFEYIDKHEIFPYNAWTQCYQRKFLKNNNFQFSFGMYFEDIYLNLDIYKVCKKIIGLNEVFYTYFRRENTITSMQSTENHLISQVKVFSKLYKFSIKKELPLRYLLSRLPIEYERTKFYYKNYGKEMNHFLLLQIKNIKLPIHAKELITYQFEKKLFYYFPIFIMKNKRMIKKVERIEKKVNSILFNK